jgi:ABC-type sugar transport system substrate-binding protein
MKKWWVCAAALLLLFVTGCGKTVPQEDPDENLIVVGVSQLGAESDWRVANSESMKAVFTEENGYRLLFDDARQQQENQITAIRKFIQQRVDYIVLLPLSESGWDSVLQEAKDAGIPVILADRMIDTANSDLFVAHVGSDFRRQGDRAVSWMEDYAAQKSGDLNIIHIQGTPGSTAQIGRTAALEEAVATHTDWHLLAQLNGDFTQAKTYEVMQQYLAKQSHADIDVLYCENDNEAFGAIQALEEAGYTCGENGVAVISFDATRNGLNECLNGRISLVVECNPLLGPLIEEVIEDVEAGRTPEKHHYIDEQIFTPDTLTPQIIAQRPY